MQFYGLLELYNVNWKNILWIRRLAIQSDHTWASGILKLSGIWEDVAVVVSVKDVWISWDGTVDVRGLSFLPGDCREVPRKLGVEVRPRSDSWAWSEFWWWDELWSNPCLIGALQSWMTKDLRNETTSTVIKRVTKRPTSKFACAFQFLLYKMTKIGSWEVSKRNFLFTAAAD